MKEELTTAMHAEFEISKEGERSLRALSLLQMERDGWVITDEDMEFKELTWEQLEQYREEFAHLFPNK
jgi:hypothetical protein